MEKPVPEEPEFQREKEAREDEPGINEGIPPPTTGTGAFPAEAQRQERQMPPATPPEEPVWEEKQRTPDMGPNRWYHTLHQALDRWCIVALFLSVVAAACYAVTRVMGMLAAIPNPKQQFATNFSNEAPPPRSNNANYNSPGGQPYIAAGVNRGMLPSIWAATSSGLSFELFFDTLFCDPHPPLRRFCLRVQK